MDTREPRIAILGFAIECNRFSPVTTAADFARKVDIRGAQILEQARAGPCRTTSDLPGFVQQMDRTGPWSAVPLRIALANPGGPVEQEFFDGFLDEIGAGLRAAGALDGVFVVSHGAALATGSDDPDGDLFAAIRRQVGPDVPVIGVFDLHANVSLKMVANLDVFVGYLENPHTDIRERGEEAARHMREILAGARTAVAMVKLPLAPPSITLLTASGPYGELIRYGQSRVGDDIVNVSIMAGFVFSDCPKNGFSVVVTARNGNRRAAFALARELGERIWSMRARFRREMTSLEQAVALSVAAGADRSAPAVLLADVADNPGGGSRGNTTCLLRALVEAKAAGVVLGVFYDPALAAEAHRRGRGAQFVARFNSAENDRFSQRFEARAAVLALSDGAIVGRRGLIDGVSASMGPSALLQIGGVAVAVISNRQQCLDPMQLEVLGVDLAAVRTLVVKSRGHFRAGFDEFFAPEQIYEVDCPGLTSPVLSTFEWTRLPRPIYPLDENTHWVAPEG
ncbi:MAG: M81 family metallopeptidase [Burkholderiaceae bacterium]|nr:M81 family metallopeptidase [Burkholderiaceae bacterium]